MRLDPLVPNHTSSFRQIRLNADLTVCEVFSIRRTINPDDPDFQTTYQEPNAGVFNLISHKGTNTIKVFDLKHNCILEATETAEFLEKVPATLKEWLLDAQVMVHSNYIPLGYGWDGKFSRSEYLKRQRAQLLFTPGHACSTELEKSRLDLILDEICRTPKMFLNLRWEEAEDFPAKRLLTSNIVNPTMKVDIIFIDNNGHHKLYKPKRIIGAVASYKGITIPDDVNKVIILTYNVTVNDDGQPLGCGVRLLSNYNSGEF